jgi:hypothetical protein
VAITIVPVIERADGKLYPPAGYLPERERNRAIMITHRLRCRERMSYRRVQRSLESFGIRRSLGQVYHDVTAYACRICDPCHPAFTGQPAQQPDS